MMDISIIREKNGMTLIEVLVVITVIAFLAAIGVPQYGRFVAKGKVKRAASELLQNTRLARTMAIKANRPYLIAFGNDNTYRIGIDVDGNGSLTDPADGYEINPADDSVTVPVRVINLQIDYGNNIVLSAANFTTVPPNDPNGDADLIDAASFQFNPNGSAGATGTVYMQHAGEERGYAYCVELANASGLINLHMWEGDADNAGETAWLEIR